MRVWLALAALSVVCAAGCSSGSSGGAAAPVAPTANAGGAYTGVVGTAVSLSGAGSSDPQGQALTYAWSFGDGGTGTGATVTHVYAAPGIFTATLTVTDTSGLSGKATAAVTVSAAAPIANAGGAYTGVVGTAVSLSGAGSSDPQGQTLTYAWSFGDGGTGTGATVTHVYAAPGIFTATLTVTDTSGLSGTSTAKVTVGPGLAGTAISGTVYTGTLPLVGAHVYLFAANTTGYGGAGIAASATNASVSLLSAANTGTSDAVGAYVATGPGGVYTLAKQYTCAAGQQLYLYVLGGNSGAGTNAATGLMAALGGCPTGAVTATVNEVTTVAAAYALAGFATDATHVGSSGTALAQVGIANAFLNAGNLASLATGAALATTPAGTGTVPQAEINTLGNVLASCTTTGSCTTLLATATGDGTATGAKATDTASAAVNIAHFPGANVAAVYGLAGTAFAPGLSAMPNDWTVALSISGGGMFGPSAIAIDGKGNAWIEDSTVAVEEISSSGAFLSGSSGYLGPQPHQFGNFAIDPSGNVWSLGESGGPVVFSVMELSDSGALLSGANGFETNTAQPGLAIDGSGNVWTGSTTGSLVELSNTGSVIGAAGSGQTGGSYAFDGSGNLWSVTPSGVEESSSTGSYIGFFQPIGIATQADAHLIAIDGAGGVWTVDAGGTARPPNLEVAKYANSGTSASGTYGFLIPNLPNPSGIAIDGAGNAWFSNSNVNKSLNSLAEMSNSGVLLSPAASNYTGGGMYGADGVAVDGSGNVWIPNSYGRSVTEFIGAGVPVVTPISVGVKMNMLGTRP